MSILLRRIAFSLALLTVVTSTGCSFFTNQDKAYAALQRDGYEQIEIIGYAPFACSEDDFYRTKFRAKKSGYIVEGVVCQGLWKGSTIRTF